jgi:hypothetical protein
MLLRSDFGKETFNLPGRKQQKQQPGQAKRGRECTAGTAEVQCLAGEMVTRGPAPLRELAGWAGFTV